MKSSKSRLWTRTTFAAYYQHLQTRAKNPLTGLQAIGVLMNKVLHSLWALIRKRADYDPACWQLNYQQL